MDPSEEHYCTSQKGILIVHNSKCMCITTVDVFCRKKPYRKLTRMLRKKLKKVCTCTYTCRNHFAFSNQFKAVRVQVGTILPSV